MEDLKKCHGPFTNSDEVQQYLDDPLVDLKQKQKRLKKEIHLLGIVAQPCLKLVQFLEFK